MSKKPQLLLVVVAYQAEKTLDHVLARVPRAVFESYDCEVLVVDDASYDQTFERGQEYELAHPEIRMRVLRNEFNQGYGGNQKMAYAYAIANGFDFVVMMHGDGQYAPEELPELLAPLKDGVADAVLGSRMITPFGALKGGMPLYKFIGNKILTGIQNRLLGTHFSEFHSGYRAYAVKALVGLPYRLNSDDYPFDTELLLQLIDADARIVERPIPTYYGREIRAVNGIKYAKDVITATVANAFHRVHLLYQRRFDTSAGNNHYDLKLGYPSSHSWAIDAVPGGTTVLDIGAGPGGVARELAKKGCVTAVVDQFPTSTDALSTKTVVQDLDEELHFDARPYRYLLMLDIIEHLRQPEQFLERLRGQFDYEPRTLIMTTPNVAFIVQRLMLMIGQFNYGKQGILDRTHMRLFTFRSAERMLLDAGYRIRRVRGIPAPFPKVLGDGWLGRAALAVNRALIAVDKQLFSYQIFIEADATPAVDFILQNTKRNTVARSKRALRPV